MRKLLLASASLLAINHGALAGQFQFGTNQIAPSAITTDRVSDGAITQPKIGAGAVDASKLAAGAALGNLGWTRAGTSLTIGTVNGLLASGHSVSIDGSGNLIDSGYPINVLTSGLTAGGAALNLGWFPTVCNNTTADQTSIANAVSAASAAGGGIVTLPSGFCALNANIPINSGAVYIKGQGRSATAILWNGTTQDTFTFGGTAFDGGISDLRIYAPGTPTGGCAINSTNGIGAAQLKNLRIERVYKGVCMNNAANAGVLYVDLVDFASIVNDAVYINGASQFFLSNSSVTTAGGNGFHLLSAGGVYLTNAVAGGAGVNGLRIDPTTGNQVFHVFASNLELDTNTGAGLYIDTTGGGYAYLMHLDNVRAGWNSGQGYYFSGPNTSQIDLTNWSSERNLLQGMDIVNLIDSHIGYGQVHGNAVGVTPYPGIDIFHASGVTIDHLTANKSYPSLADSNQSYGVNINNTMTSSDSVTITDGNVTGNVTGGIINSNVSGKVEIRNVKGFNPVGVQFPSLPASTGTFTNGPTPATAMFAGGTCSAVSVNGTALPGPQCSNLQFPLEANQTFSLTYTVAPNFTLIVK